MVRCEENLQFVRWAVIWFQIYTGHVKWSHAFHDWQGKNFNQSGKGQPHKKLSIRYSLRLQRIHNRNMHVQKNATHNVPKQNKKNAMVSQVCTLIVILLDDCHFFAHKNLVNSPRLCENSSIREQKTNIEGPPIFFVDSVTQIDVKAMMCWCVDVVVDVPMGRHQQQLQHVIKKKITKMFDTYCRSESKPLIVACQST